MNTEFILMWHQDGHGEELISCNLSADEARNRLEQLSEECGQPILPDLIVNESDDDNCGYYYVVEDNTEAAQ